MIIVNCNLFTDLLYLNSYFLQDIVFFIGIVFINLCI